MNEVKLLLKSKQKQTKDGRKFRAFFTTAMIVVKGEEEKGKQRKTLNVKFDKSVETKNYVRGIIVCDEKDIDIPFKYQIIQKNGKDSYPSVYVRKVKSYEEVKAKSTATFLLEEDETEETTIDEEVEVVENEDED